MNEQQVKDALATFKRLDELLLGFENVVLDQATLSADRSTLQGLLNKAIHANETSAKLENQLNQLLGGDEK